jgi:hypothetical protein
MSDTPAKPEQRANLTALHRELLNLATHCKPADHLPHKHVQPLQGPVIVIRGK